MWSRINTLPATHRAVIVGIVRHGSVTRLAACQRVATGTIKSRLHRVRSALRATLGSRCRSMP
jgi:DNA-directed RNA polymerase specialized sigma24 family protein